jgi:hypothetical protein
MATEITVALYAEDKNATFWDLRHAIDTEKSAR